MDGRYKIYGVVPSEQDDLNTDLGTQRIGGTVELYATDDRDEAKQIIQNGGFMRGDMWFAATWARDTATGGTIGDAPMETETN